jgi:serine/threonine-protein kinase RsbW
MGQVFTTELNATIEDLNTIYNFLDGCLDRLKIDPSKAYDIQLAVAELVTNSLVHGYPDQRGWIGLVLDKDDSQIKVILRDHAPNFDPNTASVPDPKLPLEKRHFGGYGIYLTRQVVESLTYQPIPQGGNEITLIFNIPQSG